MDIADAQLTLLAGWIDDAAKTQTGHTAQRHIDSLIPISEHAGAFADADQEAASRKATGWAFSYQIGVIPNGGKWRAVIEPYFEGPHGSARPPHVSDVPQACTEIWQALAERVTSSYGKSRLHHLLFEKGHGNARDHAIKAAESYLELSRTWGDPLDRGEALNLSLRLARAVGEATLAELAMAEMIYLAKAVISEERDLPGIALLLINPLVSERAAPEELDEVLDAAMAAYNSPFVRDEIIALKIGRSKAPEERGSLEKKRVEIWLDAANAVTGLARSSHLKTALRTAEGVGNADLIDSAASALQRVRSEDLGLVSFKASGAIGHEEFQRIMAPVTSAPDWRVALIEFARTYGPAVGRIEKNIQEAEEHAKSSLVEQLVTPEILGADGLPRFSPQDDTERQQMRLARQETWVLQAMAPLLAHALHKVAETHGIPSEEDLTEFFTEESLSSPEMAASIARCFVRYWTGDPEGAAFSAVPKIETLVRAHVIKLDAGVYRLQRDQKPGQYPGLGVLLGVLRKEGLNESWYRNILTICGNPAGGWNLRNDLAHGFIDRVESPAAAVILQCVIYLCFLGVVKREGESDVQE